jgi:hypothetical protein
MEMDVTHRQHKKEEERRAKEKREESLKAEVLPVAVPPKGGKTLELLNLPAP